MKIYANLSLKDEHQDLWHSTQIKFFALKNILSRLFRRNKPLYIIGKLRWMCNYYSPDTLLEGWTLGLDGWTLAFEGWTPYLTDGHPTWRMDTILDGWTPYLTDGNSIWQMNILFSWIVYMFNILSFKSNTSYQWSLYHC